MVGEGAGEAAEVMDSTATVEEMKNRAGNEQKSKRKVVHFVGLDWSVW